MEVIEMKENKVKAKVKKFWEENKANIVLGGICGTVMTGAGVYIFTKGYTKGFVDGGMEGFHLTLNWLDKTFPEESKAVELYERFKETHPEEIVYKKGLGKWSN